MTRNALNALQPVFSAPQYEVADDKIGYFEEEGENISFIVRIALALTIFTTQLMPVTLFIATKKA